eukprot:9816666-Alexandrium_andersonii.AAC.1
MHAPEDWRRPATTRETRASNARRCLSAPTKPSLPRISAPITVASDWCRWAFSGWALRPAEA